MPEEMLSQGFTLLEGVALGVLSGILYDTIRILRARIPFPLLGQILDLLFWFLVTITIFIWSQDAWSGRIRLYGVSSLALGAIFYFITFTSITLWIGFRFADFTHFILKVIYLPITFLILVEKKIKQIAKNLFLFWLKWYRIETMTKLTNPVSETQQKGGDDIAHQTGGNLHQARRRRGVNLFGWNPAHRHRSNPRNPVIQPNPATSSRPSQRRKRENVSRH